MCVHTPLTLWVFTFYIAPMAMNTYGSMMQFVTPLSPLREMLASMWDEDNYKRFFQPFSIPPIDELTLCSPKMESAF
jgi:hypothetical protein